ncbi:MAG: glycosyltransferase [Prevotella sp.]|nr:glycosyltransferase [Prevotella sp.]MCM1075411.1 glycosyltransferase [Ruminococcus sp.]
MKILFAGDYSNFHVTLARELRRRGHSVTVLSSGNRCMDTERDIDISRKPGIIGSFAYLNRLFKLIPSLKGFDIVQLINPNFLDLRPGKIRYFFNILKANNKHIGLSLAGSDPVTVKGCVEDNLFRYSEFRIGMEKSPYAKGTPGIEYRWLNGTMGDHCRYIYENSNVAVSALYEYHIAAKPYLREKLAYAGIPVDLDSIKSVPFTVPADGKVNLMVGIKSEYELFKGADRLLAAAREVERMHPDKCRVLIARDLPYKQYLEMLNDAHIVLDQLYSYTPATNALETMAMGKVSVSGAEPEYYDFIGEKELHPVVNVVPDDESIVDTIKTLVLSPDDMRRRAAQGREFVAKHNSSKVVTDRFIAQWDTLIRK